MGCINSVSIDIICFLMKSMLNEQEIYMMRFVNKMFDKYTQVDHRLDRICLKSAIKNKSMAYIKFVEEMKGVKLDVKKYYIDIVKTNDLKFISSLISENDNSNIRNISSYIKECNLDVIEFIFQENKENVLRNLFRHDMFCHIKQYTTKYPELISRCSDSVYINEYTNDFEFLKYMNSNGHIMPSDMISGKNIIESLEYVKWVINLYKLNKEDISSILKNMSVFIQSSPCEYSDEDILWIYEQDCIKINNIYEVAYCNSYLHLLRPEDRIPKTTFRTVLKDAKENIFDSHNILTHVTTTYQERAIIYYILHHNRLEMLNYINVRELKCIQKYISLYKALDYESYMSFFSDTNFLWEGDRINNFEIFKMWYNSYPTTISFLVKLHKNKFIKELYYCLDKSDFVIKKSELVKTKDLRYIYKSGDLKFLNYIYNTIENFKPKFITYNLFKCCKLHVLLKLDLFNKNKIFSKTESRRRNKFIFKDNINCALRYGNNEIVDYILNNHKLNNYSMFNLYKNNIKLAENVCLRGIPLEKFRSMSYDDKYCSWVNKMEFLFTKNTINRLLKFDDDALMDIFLIKYSNSVVLSEDMITQIIVSDKIFSLKSLMAHKKINFTKKQFLLISHNEYGRIFKHLISIREFDWNCILEQCV